MASKEPPGHKAIPSQEQRDSRKVKQKPTIGKDLWDLDQKQVSPFTNADFDKFIKSCDDIGTEWVKALDKYPLTVWTTKNDKMDIKSVRVRVVFEDINGETLYNVLHDHKYRCTWDENMSDGYPVQILNKTSEVGYYAAKMPKGISNRDFCNRRSWQRRDGLWVLLNSSVVHPSCPEYKGYIRAWSYLTGFLIRKVEKGIEFYYQSQADPRGSIPIWAVNWVATKFAPKLITKLKNAVLGYNDWKKKDVSKDYFPWLDDEQESIEKVMTTEELKGAIPKQRLEEVYFPKFSK